MPQLDQLGDANRKDIINIFQDEPNRWGLRGDPFLWREMKTTLSNYEYPDTEEQLI